MQCTARRDAVHCGDGCSALRLRWAKLAPKSSVLFWTREKGGETRPIWVTVAPRKFLLNHEDCYWRLLADLRKKDKVNLTADLTS